MEKFVNPFSDYGFKLLFGTELSKDLIISFLNCLFPNEKIMDITFRNVDMLGMKHDQRRAVFDIMERLPDKLNNQIFQKLKSIVEVGRMTPNERFEYELSISVESDLSAALETSFEDGEAKGETKNRNPILIRTAVQ